MGGARWRLAATLAALATVSLAITPASCATPLASRAGDPPRVYLPAADAADLASGAADHVVRAAFLLPGAPGAMLVRGVTGYADARMAALAALAACADSDAADDALRSVAEWDERHGASGRFSRRTVAAERARASPARSTPRAALIFARVSRRSAPPPTPPPPPHSPPSTDSSDTTRVDFSPTPPPPPRPSTTSTRTSTAAPRSRKTNRRPRSRKTNRRHPEPDPGPRPNRPRPRPRPRPRTARANTWTSAWRLR